MAVVTVTVTGAESGCIYTFADLPVSETVCGLKRALQAQGGTSRFQQRLLLEGSALGEDTDQPRDGAVR